MMNLLFLQLDDYLIHRGYHIDDVETIEVFIDELHILIEELHQDIDIITEQHLFGRRENAEEI